MFGRKKIYIFLTFFAFVFMNAKFLVSASDINITNNTLNNAQSLVKKAIVNIQEEILNSSTLKEFNNINIDKLTVIFENAYSLPINTTTYYTTDTENMPITFVTTGGWKSYGPPKNNNPSDAPPGRMSEMWIRDACTQMHSYLEIFKDKKYNYIDEYPVESSALINIIEGTVRQSAIFLASNPTVHAFNQNGTVATAGLEFELDTPYFFIWLAYDLWTATGNTSHFDSIFLDAVIKIVNTSIEGGSTPILNKNTQWKNFHKTGMITSEARASDDSLLLPFNIPDNMLASVQLGNLLNIMISHYPENADSIIYKIIELKQDIDSAIDVYGTLNTINGKIYAYETDGALNKTFVSNGEAAEYSFNFNSSLRDSDSFPDNNKSVEVILENLQTNTQQILTPGKDYIIKITGNTVLLVLKNAPELGIRINLRGYFIIMDDANLPSLLSIPYIGYRSNDDSLYQNTRKCILSTDNPYYFATTNPDVNTYKGIGSPHIADYTNGQMLNNIWPMSLIAQGTTSNDNLEIASILNMLINSAVPSSAISYPYDNYNEYGFPAANLIHESFSVNNPSAFTRGWFGWANAFLGEWIYIMINANNTSTN